MNEIVFNTLKEKDYIIKNYIIKIVTSLKLDLNDFLLLIFLTNQDEPTLNIENMSNSLNLSKEEIMESIDKLISINLISIEMNKDNGNIKEVINIDSLVKQVTSEKIGEQKKDDKENIFEIFEREFGRTLSPMEYEIINEWLNNGISKELISEALKEAIYNGAKSLRYVSKIILSWQEKGIKSRSENINQERRESEENTSVHLFDYNWLDEE